MKFHVFCHQARCCSSSKPPQCWSLKYMLYYGIRRTSSSRGSLSTFRSLFYHQHLTSLATHLWRSIPLAATLITPCHLTPTESQSGRTSTTTSRARVPLRVIKCVRNSKRLKTSSSSSLFEQQKKRKKFPTLRERARRIISSKGCVVVSCGDGSMSWGEENNVISL